MTELHAVQSIHIRRCRPTWNAAARVCIDSDKTKRARHSTKYEHVLFVGRRREDEAVLSVQYP